MNFTSLFIGALTLKHQTFVALRERSDVFWRGFLVLLVAALVAGVFGSLAGAFGKVAPQVSKEQVLAQANQIYDNSYTGPPELKEQFRPYATESASMIYELGLLPPRAGEGARPISAILDYAGNLLATPFSGGWTGWLLLAGLLFQFSARLLGGRASMAQMLGLTSLAAAPHIFAAVTALLDVVGALSGINSLLSFVIGVWSAVIYVKATAVAQNFSIGRALGAIAIGLLIFVGVLIVGAFLVGLVVGALVTIVSAPR